MSECGGSEVEGGRRWEGECGAVIRLSEGGGTAGREPKEARGRWENSQYNTRWGSSRTAVCQVWHAVNLLLLPCPDVHQGVVALGDQGIQGSRGQHLTCGAAQQFNLAKRLGWQPEQVPACMHPTLMTPCRAAPTPTQPTPPITRPPHVHPTHLRSRVPTPAQP